MTSLTERLPMIGAVKVLGNDDPDTWTQRVQQYIIGQPMGERLEAQLTNFINQLDYEDMALRKSNSDRTMAKFLCYSYRAQIQFKRELPAYVRDYGAIAGRQRIDAKFKDEYPLLDTSSL